ncbi:hypothetical protein NQ318_010456 [Aromia moschata]|uniref:Uncharacterized protein n=1 Tax=Aromia moschata TaxID=1265417 RepID=A0AAV8YB57_9CUCU|nr:hypothetical protein NQ318_010456 [Aromia moschata]
MGKWILLTAMMCTLEITTNLELDNHCRFHQSSLKGDQLSCTDVGLDYFQKFNAPLNRTHWLKCDGCILNVLSESAFNVPVRNNISFLDLSNSNVQILRKFAFLKFPLLKYLNLRNNSIETIDLKAFNSMKKLTQLDLSTNQLKIIINNIFSELENLDILSLNRNQIFHVQPEAFSGLINLRYLYLNNNVLKKLEENMFNHLVNLKILYLENNKISEIHPKAFLSLRNLNFLYMNNNSISYLVQYNFKPLTNLLDLQLRSNSLKEIQTSSFNGLKNIKSLYLGDNEISFVKPYGFIGLDSLHILELVNNKFEFINYFAFFSHMVNLKYLWLRRNLINNFTIDYKYEMNNSLTVLDLCDNNISSFNYQQLYQNMPNIREIFVVNNSWKCDFFSDMYDFFDVKNVSICSSDNCSLNVTKAYMDDICSDWVATEVSVDETSTDFTTDSSTAHNGALITFTVSLLLFTRYTTALVITKKSQLNEKSIEITRKWLVQTQTYEVWLLNNRTDAAIRPASVSRQVLNRTVSGDTFPTLISLDKLVGRSV